MELRQIYSQNLPNKEKWNSIFLNAEIRERCFLLLFSSLFAQAEQTIQKFVSKNPTLKRIITDDIIQTHVQSSLTSIIQPVITRVCVYEMQYASKYKMLKAETSKERFNEFVGYLSDENTALSLLDKYTVLKNIIEKSFIDFLKNTTELLDRLSNDLEEIIQTFNLPNNIFLQKIKSSGDLHNGGKSVSILEFIDENSSSFKIVYKPRSLETDLAFSNFIQWISRDIPLLSQYHQTNIYRNDYGWCEFIDHLPCLNIQEVENFYTRMGSVLAITHLLCSSDLHIENIIAHGSLPFLVDLECILSKPDPNATSQDVNRHSLVNTHILPSRIMYADEYNGIDISGISGDEGDENPYKHMSWEKSGTDQMHLVRKSSKSQKSQNKPFLSSGEKINPADFEQFIINGFKEIFIHIQKNKDFLLSKNSPLQKFNSCKIRTVLRATSTYGKLLYESYHPTFLNDSKKRLEHFEWLKRNLSISKLSNSEHILESELNDMQEENIPYFYCIANSRKLYNSQDQAISSTPLSSFDYITKHLEQYFDEKDLEIQLILIENAFYALRLTQNTDAPQNKKTIHFSRDYNFEYSTTQANEIALKIAKKHLDHLKKYSQNFSEKVQWPLIENVGKSAWTVSSSLNKHDLYNGTSGLMLTFAYGSKIFNNTEYFEIFSSCLNTLSDYIATNIKSFNDHFLPSDKKDDLPPIFQNLGFYSGCGGYLYSLGIIANLFPDQKIKKLLNEILNNIEHGIEHNKGLDVISGIAGFIMGLVSVKDLIPETLFINLLQKSTDNLITLYPNLNKSLPQSSSEEESPLLGLSHGISGLVLALSKSNKYLKRLDVQNLIDKSIEFEDHFYCQKNKNWPDFRKDSQHPNSDLTDKFMMAWCHGSPGIGLARIEMQEYYHHTRCEADIKNAVDSVLNAPIYLPLALCHSTLGNTDLILNAKQNNYINGKACANYISDFLRHAEQHDSFMQFEAKLAMPGMMLGHAGIAYQMMRISNPSQVPSILV